MLSTTRAMQVIILRIPATRCPTLQPAAENVRSHQAAYVQWNRLWFMTMLKGTSMFRTTRGTWNQRLKIYMSCSVHR